MGKHSAITGILICCILCGITLFVSSSRFVNAEVTPKWLGLMLAIGVMGLGEEYAVPQDLSATDRKDEALAMAKIIIDKDVKIPSPTVTAIKNEMRRLIEAQETSTVPENDNRTSDEPKNNDTRQGETPEQGAALPP